MNESMLPPGLVPGPEQLAVLTSLVEGVEALNSGVMLPGAESLLKVLLPRSGGNALQQRLGWLERAVAVPGVLPVRAQDAASARAAVRELNNLSNQPLAEWIEGEVGQGLRLTARGRRLTVALLVARQAQERLLSHFGMDFADDVRVLERVVVRTSARNQFAARVEDVISGEVQDRVILALPGHRRLGALITRSSAEALGLRAGVEVLAMIKASAIQVMDEANSLPAASGHNQLRGTVLQVQPGEDQSELTVDLGESLTAIAVARHGGRRQYAVGQNVWLAIDPTTVIIGIVA